MQKEAEIRDPLILGNKSYHDITKDVSRPVEGNANKYWWILFGLSFVGSLIRVCSSAMNKLTGYNKHNFIFSYYIHDFIMAQVFFKVTFSPLFFYFLILDQALKINSSHIICSYFKISSLSRKIEKTQKSNRTAAWTGLDR